MLSSSVDCLSFTLVTSSKIRKVLLNFQFIILSLILIFRWFLGVADTNDVIKKIEKTLNNTHTTTQKLTNNSFRNTKEHPIFLTGIPRGLRRPFQKSCHNIPITKGKNNHTDSDWKGMKRRGKATCSSRRPMQLWRPTIYISVSLSIRPS